MDVWGSSFPKSRAGGRVLLREQQAQLGDAAGGAVASAVRRA